MVTQNNKINIIVADDSPTCVKAIVDILEVDPGFFVIGTYKNGLELVNSPILSKADIILIDIEMPELNGLEAAIRINYMFPKMPMVAVTMHQDELYLFDIIKAGFKAFIYKPNLPVKLHDVINLVMKNELMFPDDLKIVKA